MWLSALLLAELASCSILPSPIDDDETKLEQVSSYVKVEIKGTLETKGAPEDKWESILKGSSTGVRIVAPGKLNAGRRDYPPDGWPAPTKYTAGPLGLSWEISLGEDKELKKRVKDLKGKSVVTRGTLIVDVQSFGWRFPTTIRYIVRVSSLEEANPQK
jgi:hypothetical protein